MLMYIDIQRIWASATQFPNRVLRFATMNQLKIDKCSYRVTVSLDTTIQGLQMARSILHLDSVRP